MKHIQQLVIAFALIFASFGNEVNAQQDKESIPYFAARVSSVEDNGGLNLDPSSELMSAHLDKEGGMFCCQIVIDGKNVEKMFLYFKDGKLYLCEIASLNGRYVSVYRPYRDFVIIPRTCEGSM